MQKLKQIARESFYGICLLIGIAYLVWVMLNAMAR